MRIALVALILVGCTASPASSVDAAAPTMRVDLAHAPADFALSPMSDLAVLPPDLAPPPDLWMCQPMPGPCGCPGVACCTDVVNGKTYQFCAGVNTLLPDPNQSCFIPANPTCLACGGLKDPCCFDGNDHSKLSCHTGFECHQIKCTYPDDPTCYGCDVQGCGLFVGSPCCVLPPYICANGLQCKNGVCK